MFGDGAYGIRDWHDLLLTAEIVPIDSYNPRNADDPPNIEYRTEDCITKHNEEIKLTQSMLEETYNCWI